MRPLSQYFLISFLIAVVIVSIAYFIALSSGQTIGFETIWKQGVRLTLIILQLITLVILLIIFGGLNILISLFNLALAALGLPTFSTFDLNQIVTFMNDFFQELAKIFDIYNLPRIDSLEVAVEEIVEEVEEIIDEIVDVIPNGGGQKEVPM